MKTMIRDVKNGNVRYKALMFCCPGCIEFGGSGIHLLAINSTEVQPSWNFEGTPDKPTLSPSILTTYPHGTTNKEVCHSFLRNGVFEFLNDCTHSLAGQKVDIPDLPDWIVKAGEDGDQQ